MIGVFLQSGMVRMRLVICLFLPIWFFSPGLRCLSAQAIRVRVAEMLIQPKIQAELSLNEKQKDALRQIDRDLKLRIARVVKRLKELSPRDRDLYFKGEFARINSDVKEKLKKLLTTDQQRRLQQIGYQQIGHLAFLDREVQDQIRMTESQKNLLFRLHREYLKLSEELKKKAGTDSEKIRQMAKRLREERTKIVEQITKTFRGIQKLRWSRVIGRPFSF